MEESTSHLEKTANKLLPILDELEKRMIDEKKEVGKARKKPVETLDSNEVDTGRKAMVIRKQDQQTGEEIFELKLNAQPDMKTILGYLNQGEWTTGLSIGSIMQLQPVSLRDMLEQGKNELELTREAFITKISFLAVSYFCYSTEIRFILQMKEDPSWDPTEKQSESEFWHAKALEIACSFLPGDCPLVNHINLSYQKHFAPSKQTINEDEQSQDNVKVIKPLNGIENQKFTPIIR